MSTLIVYATKHGATERCASMLSGKIAGRVDLHNLKTGKGPNLDGYEKVIIGGSIYMGKIQKEVSEFCSQNLNVLKNKKLGLYICCMLNDSAESQLKRSFSDELYNVAVAKASFGGEMKFSSMGFGERLITRMVAKMVAKKDANPPATDGKKDVSMISEEAIDKFAQLMNDA